MNLSPEDHDALREIIAAGPDGLTLKGRSVTLSAAIRLEASGYVALQNGHRLIAFATQAGKAFAWRTAA